jgi:hypothetical protein
MFGSGCSLVWYFNCGTNIGAVIIVHYDPVMLSAFLTISEKYKKWKNTVRSIRNKKLDHFAILIATVLCSIAVTKHVIVSSNQQAWAVSQQNLVSSLHCEGFHFCLHDNSSSQWQIWNFPLQFSECLMMPQLIFI